MLEGDSSDNIPGINKVGPKTVDKIFAAKQNNINTIRDEVKELYKKQYGDSWYSAYTEVGNLLWIRRIKDQPCPLLEINYNGEPINSDKEESSTEGSEEACSSHAALS
jgi:5'-3' exonuclease